jgi:hypothetical protein
MFYARVVPAILIGLTLACGGSDRADAAAEGASAPRSSAGGAADLPDPCSLVTDAEVSDFLWQGMEANQRQALQARNAEHVITKRVENVEGAFASRTCHFQYRRVAGDTVWGEGDFRLRTLSKEGFQVFADARSSREPIPGVGDQAFYMSNAAYGRRGDVGVEVVDFSSKEIEIELLKDAVARLP